MWPIVWGNKCLGMCLCQRRGHELLRSIGSGPGLLRGRHPVSKGRYGWAFKGHQTEWRQEHGQTMLLYLSARQ